MLKAKRIDSFMLYAFSPKHSLFYCSSVPCSIVLLFFGLNRQGAR